MKRILIIMFFLGLFFGRNVFAQVEHNYPMGPQKTNCDSLSAISSVFSEALHAIEISTWRFKQSIKLNRLNGILRAEYYSCDGQTGFLIVLTSNKECIYKIVPVNLWNEFLKTNDPEKYIDEKISKNFESDCNH